MSYKGHKEETIIFIKTKKKKDKEAVEKKQMSNREKTRREYNAKKESENLKWRTTKTDCTDETEKRHESI